MPVAHESCSLVVFGCAALDPLGDVLNDDSIAVLFGADDNCARPLAASLRSVVMTAAEPERLHFYVFARMSAENKDRIRLSCQDVRLEFIDIADEFLVGLNGGVGVSAHVSPAMWLRIFAADVLPSTLQRVVYLDCDTITRSDIAQLWNLDLEGYGVGAGSTRLLQFTAEAELTGTYGSTVVTGEEKYFNSGVLVLDLDFWRRNNIREQVVHTSRVHGERFTYADQDALNLVFLSQWADAGFEWNNSTFAHIARGTIEGNAAYELSNAKLLHFTTERKPWQSWFPAGIGRNIYLAAEAFTDWSDAPLVEMHEHVQELPAA